MADLEKIDSLPALPERPLDAHKGTFGTVVVIGGSQNMIGAPAIAASAALRTGCGLARIMTWPDLIPHCLTIEPSATGIAVPYLDDPQEIARLAEEFGERTVLAVGPGMGTRQVAQRGVEIVLGRERPVVLDADGLNNLARLGRRVGRPKCSLVLTPHPGEYQRLAETSGIELDAKDPQQRPQAAAALAERYGAVVVLKGYRTVISDGRRFVMNTTGNPAMATAGTGDVLTGVIASLMAQSAGDGSLFDAAVLGVHLHGLAADLWVERHEGSPAGMMARDLANWIPHAIMKYRKGPAA